MVELGEADGGVASSSGAEVARLGEELLDVERVHLQARRRLLRGAVPRRRAPWQARNRGVAPCERADDARDRAEPAGRPAARQLLADPTRGARRATSRAPHASVSAKCWLSARAATSSSTARRPCSLSPPTSRACRPRSRARRGRRRRARSARGTPPARPACPAARTARRPSSAGPASGRPRSRSSPALRDRLRERRVLLQLARDERERVSRARRLQVLGDGRVVAFQPSTPPTTISRCPPRQRRDGPPPNSPSAFAAQRVLARVGGLVQLDRVGREAAPQPLQRPVDLGRSLPPPSR